MYIALSRLYMMRVMIVCLCSASLSIAFWCRLSLFLVVSVSPSSCALLSSSPCNSFLLSPCSPYNQVFFMLFCKMLCESILSTSWKCAHLNLFSCISFLKTWQIGNVPVKKAHLFMVKQFIMQGFMCWSIQTTDLMHFFIHSGHYFGGRNIKMTVTVSIFLYIKICHLYMKEGEPSLIYAILSVTLGLCCCFDVIFQCKYSLHWITLTVLSMKRPFPVPAKHVYQNNNQTFREPSECLEVSTHIVNTNSFVEKC